MRQEQWHETQGWALSALPWIHDIKPTGNGGGYWASPEVRQPPSMRYHLHSKLYKTWASVCCGATTSISRTWVRSESMYRHTPSFPYFHARGRNRDPIACSCLINNTGITQRSDVICQRTMNKGRERERDISIWWFIPRTPPKARGGSDENQELEI